MLRALAPGVVWVAALLAAMLSLNHLFANDHADGTLEQLVLAPYPLTVLVLAKTAAHWVPHRSATGAALAATGVTTATARRGDEHAGGVVAAWHAGAESVGERRRGAHPRARGGGVLVSLLVLPLYTPVLIFGASSVTAAAEGLSTEAHLSLLSAFLVLALSLVPWARRGATCVTGLTLHVQVRLS